MTLPWLIVDGYNLIGARRALASLSAEDLDTERQALVARVSAFAHDTYRGVVVFDAARNPFSDGAPHHAAGVAVIFSPAGIDADAVIERLARRARERRERVTVATSDAQTQWTVLGEGALRMSAEELLEAMDAEAADAAEQVTDKSRSKLQDRLDIETRDRLARWARGER